MSFLNDITSAFQGDQPVWGANQANTGYQYGGQGPVVPNANFNTMTPDVRMGLENNASGSMFGGMFDNFGDTTTLGKNGAQTTNQGWGGAAMGLGNMYLNWTQGKAQQELGEDQLAFSKEQFYKNYAMQMDQYRRRVNKGNASLAYAAGGHKGPWSQTMSKYNDGSAILDENGIQQADPTYGAVSAFSPTIAGLSPEANSILGQNTGLESVEQSAESSRKRTPAQSTGPSTEATAKEAKSVEDLTKKKKIG